MEIMHCRKCKKLFSYSGFGPRICQSCQKEEEEKFKLVKDFLYEFPGASLPEVASATEVEAWLIERFLRDGRLEVAKGSAIEIPCENCGKPIKSGRFCDACSIKLSNEMKAAVSAANQNVKQVQRKNGREEMHYLK